MTAEDLKFTKDFWSQWVQSIYGKRCQLAKPAVGIQVSPPPYVRTPAEFVEYFARAAMRGAS